HLEVGDTVAHCEVWLAPNGVSDGVGLALPHGVGFGDLGGQDPVVACLHTTSEYLCPIDAHQVSTCLHDPQVARRHDPDLPGRLVERPDQADDRGVGSDTVVEIEVEVMCLDPLH